MNSFFKIVSNYPRQLIVHPNRPFIGVPVALSKEETISAYSFVYKITQNTIIPNKSLDQIVFLLRHANNLQREAWNIDEY
ncbi:MAG: hypothetical protein V7776_21815 [Halopseudomonas aestusnigri]